LWSIEKVECFRAKLKVCRFIRPRQPEILGERRIDVVLARALHDTGSRVAESSGNSVVAHDRIVTGKAAGIHVIVNLVLDGARGHVLSARTVSAQFCEVTRD